MCRTRWVERHESFETFIDLYQPLTTCLELIANGRPDEWNRETRADAHSFILSLSQFSFIVAFVLAQKILSYMKGLSTKLQGRYIDVVRAYRDVELVNTTIKDGRSDYDSFHTLVYAKACSVAEGVNVQEATPRFANSSRQSHQSNPPAESASEYYKRSLTIPMLDHLIMQLDDRFSAESTSIIREFVTLFPAEICKHTEYQ